MAEISESKKTLSQDTLRDLCIVLVSEPTDRVKLGLLELFQELPNKSLERFRGLIAGIPTPTTPAA